MVGVAGVGCALTSDVAALFVDVDGVYSRMPGVDCWDAVADARMYGGGYPVVAHPPCERWGRLWPAGGGRFGDDAGCFASALESVLSCGGVLEHPASSGAFSVFGLGRPSLAWSRKCVSARLAGAACYSIEVEQGLYGHPAPKRTWLFYVGRVPPLPALLGRSSAVGRVETLGRRARRATPPAFAEYLVSLARVSRG